MLTLIFVSVFVGSKTDTYENGLVWTQPQTLIFKSTFLTSIGSRSRSDNDQIPPDLLNEIDLDQDEELLQEILEDVQVRTNFPEMWLYEDETAG